MQWEIGLNRDYEAEDNILITAILNVEITHFIINVCTPLTNINALRILWFINHASKLQFGIFIWIFLR